MTRMVIASGNAGKIGEFREALGHLGIELVSAAEAGVTGFPPEVGTSYDENALMKAAYASMKAGLPALADDSGIEVDALDGAPGVHSARFGGSISDGERIALLLDRMRQRPGAPRTARFVTSIVLAVPSGDVHVFHGETRGTILEGPRGSRGFGYDPIFYVEAMGKTFAEATLEEKRQNSHRGRALRAFTEWLASPEGSAIVL